MGSHVLRLSLLTSLLMVAACGTTQVSIEKARTVERQLLLPYLHHLHLHLRRHALRHPHARPAR